MKKLNLYATLFIICAGTAAFGQDLSAEKNVDVKAELVLPITIESTLLDFKKVVIHPTGVRFYHVRGDGSMYSSNSGTALNPIGPQTDFQGSPTVSSVTFTGMPDTPINITGGNGRIYLTNEDGDALGYYPRYYINGSATEITSGTGSFTRTLNSEGKFFMSLAGQIIVNGLDQDTPSEPGIYTGTTLLTAQY